MPRAVLEFAYPLHVPGPEPEGAAVLDEIDGRHAPHVVRAMRMLRAWARGPEASAALFQALDADAWLAELRPDAFDRAAWAPLFCIADQLRAPAELEVPHVARACMALAEWAFDQAAEATGLLLVETAALVWEEHPGYAWLTGRMLRSRGEAHEAECWLVRSARLGASQRNWAAQARALNSLGNLYLERGDLVRASEVLGRALRLARRRGLRIREGKILHDLFVHAVVRSDFAAAEAHAAGALERLGPGHPDLVPLAHDVAHLWCEQGHFSRALTVFRSLLPHFPDLSQPAAGPRLDGASSGRLP